MIECRGGAIKACHSVVRTLHDTLKRRAPSLVPSNGAKREEEQKKLMQNH